MYESVKSAALRWGISERRVRLLCAQGRIPGAYQIGRGWHIPSDTKKPYDARFKTSTIEASSLEQKKLLMTSLRPLSIGEQQQIDADFITEFIYNSEAMAGNPLSIKDTDLVLNGIGIEDKPFKYQQNTLSHKKAFDFMAESVKLKRVLSAEFIKQLHSLVLEGLPEDRGQYRRVPVRMFGASHTPAEPYMIESEIERLIFEYNKSKEPLLAKIARFHITFESIRPFIDGNGRVGRLLINFELMKEGYPPLLTRFVDRKRYYDAFESYHYSGSIAQMESLIAEGENERLNSLINLLRNRPRSYGAINGYMNNIVYQFKYEGNPVSCESLGSGHVNKSFSVATDTGKKYVLQCISSVAFHDVPGLMKNAIAVSKFINGKGGRTLNFIPSVDGEYYYVDENNDYWRSYEHVDALCLQAAERPEDFYESAVAFGTFQNMLDDFPADTLCETIPNFHNTPDRFTKLHNAINADVVNRVKQVQHEIDFALAREASAGALVEMLYVGDLPLRVTHNDTKLNNVLLDKNTRKALCVIDLDTVMPGLSAFDFGDAIRYGASTAAEDEQDLSRVHINLYLYRMFARGFLKACPNLTENEKDVLALGSKIITLECGIRFLTDYLDGDKYFGISYPEHNLDRARTQFKLVQDMEDHWNEMETIIREESYRFI